MPTVRLTDIFRQAQRSLIVQNAHRIVEGQMPQKGGPKDDFFLIESNGLACQKLVCDLVSTRLPKAYGFDPVRDIQVLCPTKVGPTGSVELNRRLQDILNPPAKGKGQIGTAESAKILRLGDKVMQIKNDYDITFERAGAEAGVGAYNGDLGIITAVDVDARSVTVQMDDKKVHLHRRPAERAGARLRCDRPQEPGLGVPRGDPARGRRARPAVLPQPFVHRRDPRAEALRSDRHRPHRADHGRECAAEYAVQRAAVFAEGRGDTDREEAGTALGDVNGHGGVKTPPYEPPVHPGL